MTKLITVGGIVIFTIVSAGFAQVKEPRERRFNAAELSPANPAPGVTSRRVFADAVAITMVTIDQGATTPHHNHPDEQIMIMNTGRARIFIEDRQFDLGPGDILVIPSYLEHHVTALEPTTWTEVHGPGFHNNANFANELLTEIAGRER